MTATHAALAYRFTVSCTDARLQAHVEHLLATLMATDGGAAGADAFVLDTRSPAGPFELRLGGEVVVSSTSRAGPLAHLLHQVNLRAVESSTAFTLLHAAAACGPAGPVVFPAAMESGKSTLVTALVMQGWSYVTDEVVALQPSGEIVPYPRAISLDPGSWALFPGLRPTVDPALSELLPRQWQVSVPSVGGRVAVDPGPAVAVVFPTHTPGGPTRIDPIAPLDGLRRLLEATFHLERQPRRDLEVLAAIANRAPCYRLTVGDLGEACRLLAAESRDLETARIPAVTVAPGTTTGTEVRGRHVRRVGSGLTRSSSGADLVVHHARRT